MPIEPGKIRNVAVVGHRGTGKTSLVEAMLFQAEKVNRLGAVEAGATTSDWGEGEEGTRAGRARRGRRPRTGTRTSSDDGCRWQRPSATSSGRGARST